MVVRVTNRRIILVFFCCLFGEDPGVGTTCVEDSPDLLRDWCSHIELADIGQVLRIGERLFDFEISAF